jgi:hypothetical protein
MGTDLATVQALLTADDQETLNTYVATISLALTVYWRFEDKRKR